MFHAQFAHILELVGDEGPCVHLYQSLHLSSSCCQATARWLCTHAGRRSPLPVLTEEEDVDEMGRKGGKSEKQGLEDRLVHSFTPNFPWPAFEAAAKQLKASTCMGLVLSCPHCSPILVKF